jgi:uncharacterized protein YcnI
MKKSWTAAVTAAIGTLVFAAGASAHARVSPPVSLSGQLQLFSLTVPTEKEGVTTTKVVFTPPSDFSIDSLVPPPRGWRMAVSSKGSGEDAVVQKVTWTGGSTPTGQDSLFQFVAEPSKAGSYTFGVQQTYSDGSIVDWDGSESSEAPAPTIEAKSSLGGGGSSIVADIALVLSILALVAAGFSLVRGGGGGAAGGRELA